MNLLHISQDASFAGQVAGCLERCESTTYNVEHAVDIKSGVARIAQAKFDAVKFDAVLLDVTNQPESYEITDLREQAGGAPILAVADEAYGNLQFDQVKRHVEGVLCKNEIGSVSLDNSIRAALKQRVSHLGEINAGLRGNVDKIQPIDSVECESVTKIAAVIFPVSANGFVDTAGCQEVAVSRSGSYDFRIQLPSSVVADSFIFGITDENGVARYAIAKSHNTSRHGNRVTIDAKFAAKSDAALRFESLMPRWDEARRDFVLDASQQLVESLCRAGIAQPCVVDRLLVCPECNAFPTVHIGCRSCGAAAVTSRQHIHHYACAFVGPANDFEGAESLVCPKCRTKDLVIGTDFEYIDGQYECLGCGWSDTEVEMIGQCHECDSRFALELAESKELIGYHVERLDPLALFATP